MVKTESIEQRSNVAVDNAQTLTANLQEHETKAIEFKYSNLLPCRCY